MRSSQNLLARTVDHDIMNSHLTKTFIDFNIAALVLSLRELSVFDYKQNQKILIELYQMSEHSDN